VILRRLSKALATAAPIGILVLWGIAFPVSALAQGPAIEDAGSDGGPAVIAPLAAPPVGAPTTPAATATSENRPVRGPAVRERNAPRSRGGATASGALMLTILVGALGYYVIKRIRR
jgi:hypothetical protein